MIDGPKHIVWNQTDGGGPCIGVESTWPEAPRPSRVGCLEEAEVSDALKAAREVLDRWQSGGPRPAHASRQELAGALRTALAEFDRHQALYLEGEEQCNQLVKERDAEIDRLTASEQRLQWVLPLVTGTDDDVADGRTAALMMAFGRGLDGIEAIDYAMKERP